MIDLSNKTDRELLILLVDHINQISELLGKQNGRLRALELWRAGIIGAMALGAVAMPIATALVIRLF